MSLPLVRIQHSAPGEINHQQSPYTHTHTEPLKCHNATQHCHIYYKELHRSGLFVPMCTFLVGEMSAVMLFEPPRCKDRHHLKNTMQNRDIMASFPAMTQLHNEARRKSSHGCTMKNPSTQSTQDTMKYVP